MISICDHLDRPDADTYLIGLARQHWNKLNGVRMDGTYKSNSLIAKVNKYLELSEHLDYFVTYAERNSEKLTRQQNFFNTLLEYDNLCLEQIITSKPDELTLLREEIMGVLEDDDLYLIQDGSESQTPFGQLLSSKIFSYKTFRNSQSCVQLLKAIGFGSVTCPYCNYNKLDVVPNLGSKNVSDDTTAYLDMDHFFSKVRNPFFAVSFFNLVPSCHSCNSTDKGAKVFSIDSQIHPYFNSFDDYFRFRVSLIALLGGVNDEVFIDSIKSRASDQTVRDFNLLAKYNHILPDVKSLVNRFIKYKSYIGTAEEPMFVELLLGDIPQDRKNILRHPTAKFKRDVLRQIDIKGVLKIN
ncbi:hypothetical protein [Massilia sp. BKSP1R2A-1]|uniref:hypothetical protein n=1 Tax=Massilia sp. BKSP1R2A-1 TaxID=3422595 RepID=UPI003D33D6DD